MKKLLRLLCLSFIGLAALSCYDDSKIWENMEEYEARLAQLETLCNTMNINTESLQAIVEAIKNNDYVTKVEPITEGGVEVGYAITFAKTGTVKVYHGKDGQNGTNGQDGANGTDGTTPVISVKQDTDKEWYWTINGEWLTDEDGNKIKATATDGKDGEDGKDGKDGKDAVVPTLKIEEGYWYVSYDGKTWTKLDKATGDSGSTGIFQKVYQDGGYLYLVLTDGTSYKVPVDASAASSSSLDITFDVEQGVQMVPGVTYKIGYKISGGGANNSVRVIGNDTVTAYAKPESATSGYIYVYIYDWFDGPFDPDREESYYSSEEYGDRFPGLTEEEAYHSSLYLVVSATDGNKEVSKTLHISEGIIESYYSNYMAEPEGGNLTVEVATNTTYEVSVPSDATWLSYSPTKADVRIDQLVFSLKENNTDKVRTARVDLVNEDGSSLDHFTISQKPTSWNRAMQFADPAMERACVEAFDWNGDGIFTYGEAYETTDLWNLKWVDRGDVTSFDELEYFASVTEIPYDLFSWHTNLKSVKLPPSITAIYDWAFCGTSINTLEIPASVEYIAEYAFRYCYNLKSVKMLGENPCEAYNAFDIFTIISVPDGCYDAYKNHWAWRGEYNFAQKDVTIVQSSPDGNESIWHTLTNNGDGWYVADVPVHGGWKWYVDVDGYISLRTGCYVNPDSYYWISSSNGTSYFPGTGTVKVYVSEDLQNFKYEGELVYDAIQDWYLVGYFNDWTVGDAAYKMTRLDDTYVYRGITFTEDTEVKFNAGDWSVNRGGDFTSIGGAIPVTQDGMNIKVPAGTYDVYLNLDATIACFVTSSSLISIDGNFSDWDSLEDYQYSYAQCSPDARWTALKTMKAYADNSFIYVYFEFDESQIEDRELVPFHVYLDSDGDSTTGGYGQWSDLCSDYILEEAVIFEGNFCSYDPGVYLWEGPSNESGWYWGMEVYPYGCGLGRGAASDCRYELALSIDVLRQAGIEVADTFGIGIDIQQSWSSVGVLPNSDVTDENPSGTAPMLKVTIDR